MLSVTTLRKTWVYGQMLLLRVLACISADEYAAAQAPTGVVNPLNYPGANLCLQIQAAIAGNAVFEHPWNLWIGHGFDSWWKVVPPFGNEMFEARHAENELLQQFYAYGAVGVVLFTGIYGSLFRQLRKLGRGPTRILFLSVLIFILVRGLAAANSFDLLLPLWSIVLISVIVERESALNSLTPEGEIVIPL